MWLHSSRVTGGQEGLGRCWGVTSLGHWLLEQIPGVPAHCAACHCTVPWSPGNEREHCLKHSPIPPRPAGHPSDSDDDRGAQAFPPGVLFRSPICCPTSRTVCLSNIRVSPPLPRCLSEDTAHVGIRPTELQTEVPRGSFFHLRPLSTYSQDLETIKSAQRGLNLLNQSVQAVVLAGLMLPWAACFVTARSCVRP